jgi:hypothetical protein
MTLQVALLSLSLTNRTEPSCIVSFTPPAWRELASTNVCLGGRIRGETETSGEPVVPYEPTGF